MDIKEVWHKMDERPMKSCHILLYDVQGFMGVGYYSKQHDLVQTDEAPDGDSFTWGDHSWYTHWCYVDDIKPKEL